MALSTNPTYDYTDVIIWTGLEVNVSVIVVALPTLRSWLASKVKFFSSTNGGSGQALSSDPYGSAKGTKKSGRSRHMRIPSGNGKRPMDTDRESQIELDVRSKGFTQVEISTSSTPRDDNDSDNSTYDGIYVTKTSVVKR
jgi:hypothetical protein